MYLDHIGAHGGEVMYFECFCFRGELGFLDCDAICMCVVNKHFELLEFVFNYVDLKYNDISLTFTAGYVWSCCFKLYIPYCVHSTELVCLWILDFKYILLLSCGRLWSVCEVVWVPYVGTVIMMHVLLFVLHVSMVRECEGARRREGMG